MATASVGSSSPSAAPGLPQQSRAIDPNTPEKQQTLSSPRSSSSLGSAGSRGPADEANAPSSDAADDGVLRHPKGKRKRTAAKDKAILESAYLANPKPDKTARLDIVNQVSLNEKEVQIWFQNRRQNDRRKSRPLSPQEIAALRLGGLHALSDPPSFLSYPHGAMSSSPPQHPSLHLTAASTPNGPSTTPLSSPELGPWEPEALARKRAEEEQLRQQQQPPQKPDQTTPRGLMPSLSFSSSTSSIGYLANRWNHSSFSSSFGAHDAHNDSGRLDRFPSLSALTGPVLPPPPPQQPQQQQKQQQQQQPHQPRPQRPSNRPFRLSLSLEGKAEVIASMSPSPPRRLPPPQPMAAPVPFDVRRGSSSGSSGSSSAGDSPLPSLPAIRRSGLSRSQSVASNLGGGGFTLPPISSLTGTLESGSTQAVHPPRLLRGRSRDVHAWVSVCNADTRIDDELSAQAQDEASGSAIAAISLLRSTSSTSLNGILTPSSVLQPNGARRNTVARSTGPRPGMKRSKLSRTLSSVGRLQSGTARNGWADEDKTDRVWMDDEKKKKLKLSTLLSGNDSDKENWSPDEEGRAVFTSPQQRSGMANRKPLPMARSGQQQQQQRTVGRVLGDSHHRGNGHVRSTSELLIKRPMGGSGTGRATGPFDGLDIYEDAASDGGSGRPTKQRGVLSRALTAPGSAGTEEVERFMRGGEVSPSKKGDLDCVAGLLSLSQGIWR